MYNAWLEINIDNLKHNINCIKSVISPNTEIMAVVKDDAYQMGALFITEKLMECGVSDFAVANYYEARELKDAYPNINILMLGHIQECEFADAIKHDLIISVSTLTEAKQIDNAAREMGKKAIVHIKVDTGMNRIGFKYNESDMEDMNRVFELEYLDIRAMYSHYSSADMDRDYTEYQKDLFGKFKSALKEEYRDKIKYHINNSAAIGDNSNTDCDYIRPGIIMYGYDVRTFEEKTEMSLKPVMQFKAKVMHVKELDTDEKIGYGHTFTTKRKTKVATIGVGYGDGYSRRLGNVFYVMLNGQYAPIVGNVCMDQTMIDVTDIEASVGDDVTLIGVDGNREISLETYASELNEIPYSILCQIQKRVTRQYIEADETVAVANYYEGLVREEIK